MMTAQVLYKLVWMSRPLMQAAEASVEKGLAGTGLTVRMRAVLEILNSHGEMTVPEIATKLEIKRQYVQVMVNETVSEGLTVQKPNPRHKKSSLLILTDKGRELISDVISKELEVMRALSAEIDGADAETALNVVLAVTTELKSYAGSDD